MKLIDKMGSWYIEREGIEPVRWNSSVSVAAPGARITVSPANTSFRRIEHQAAVWWRPNGTSVEAAVARPSGLGRDTQQ